MQLKDLRKISAYEREFPKTGDMRVPGRIFASEALLRPLLSGEVEGEGGGQEWNALVQVRNVASLPGIVRASSAMPDIHPGYGFPIGGVGAFDPEEGVVAMGGVGFDINCGVRTLATPLIRKDIAARKEEIADRLFAHVPAELGSEGKIRLTLDGVDEMLRKGAKFALERGYGVPEDLEHIEEGGDGGGRLRRGVPQGQGTGVPAGGHPRLGQPLPGGAARGGDLRPGGSASL